LILWEFFLLRRWNKFVYGSCFRSAIISKPNFYNEYSFRSWASSDGSLQAQASHRDSNLHQPRMYTTNLTTGALNLFCYYFNHFNIYFIIIWYPKKISQDPPLIMKTFSQWVRKMFHQILVTRCWSKNITGGSTWPMDLNQIRNKKILKMRKERKHKVNTSKFINIDKAMIDKFYRSGGSCIA